MERPNLIISAGGLLYRHFDARPHFALVRTARNGNWGLPKGKMKFTDQTLRTAAIREVEEETGFEVECHGYAGDFFYAVDSGTKIVVLWNMVAIGEQRRAPAADVAELTWCRVSDQLDLVSRAEERRFLAATLDRDLAISLTKSKPRVSPGILHERFSTRSYQTHLEALIETL